MTDWMPTVDAAYDRDLELVADVCVIGTGAGGAVLASELAEAGLSVVMLEKGGYHTRKAFNQQERDMMPLLFEEGGARTTKDGGISVLHGTSVGGSTTVNWAICFDPPEAVLEDWATRHGIDRIRLQDLQPSLRKVRRILNVQPIPPEAVNENGRLLLEGARKLGMTGGIFEHNRTQCLSSGFCILGCAYDRKQSMLVTYVPRAIHFGARLLPNAEATEFEREGDRITAVRGVLTHPETGAQYQVSVRAKVFSVSGGAVSTPVLLKQNGLGNAHVGRNLTVHPTTAAVGLFDHDVKAYQGIHFTTYVSDLEPEGILIESIFAYPGLMGSNLFRWGSRAIETMAQYDKMAAAIVLLHDDGRGQVDVDKWGLPEIDYWVNSKDQEKFRKGLDALARIYLAAGAREVLVPHSDGFVIRSEADLAHLARMPIVPNRMAVFSAHQMGTAAMGADPDHAATDSWGRLHGMENLFVCDGSLFPSSLGVNPQITIAALGDRTARYLLSESKRFFE
jgi:choline dehydrogenase-like flavoprotein